MIGAALAIALLASGPARVAVLVGNNEGMSDESPLRYAETDAEKMADVLTKLGGFSPTDIRLLTGTSASTLRRALSQVSVASDGLLLFYYSGHSDGRSLHMAGSKLPLDELRTLLKASQARVEVVVVDACKSGTLVREKGAQLGPAFDVSFGGDANIEGQVVITSSSADEASQESDILEGSFFTHHWVGGLYGAADSNADNIVTLEEAYRYASFATLEETLRSQGGVQHPAYRYDFSGQGDVVLSYLSANSASLTIEASKDPGQYFVLDAGRKRVLTQVEPARLNKEIRLPPGSYLIRKRETNEQLLLNVDLADGESRVVRDAMMQRVRYQQHEEKGAGTGLFHGPRFTVGFQARVKKHSRADTDLRVGYLVALRHVMLEPRVSFRFIGNYESGYSSKSFVEIDTGAFLAWRTQKNRWQTALGLDAGFTTYRAISVFGADALKAPNRDPNGVPADPPPPKGAISLGYQAALRGEMFYTPGSNWVIGAYALAGTARFSQDGETRRPFVLGAGLALARHFR